MDKPRTSRQRIWVFLSLVAPAVASVLALLFISLSIFGNYFQMEKLVSSNLLLASTFTALFSAVVGIFVTALTITTLAKRRSRPTDVKESRLESVLSDTTTDHDANVPERTLFDLSGMNLKGIDLSSAGEDEDGSNLSNINFTAADLSHANLDRVNLAGTILLAANLDETRLRNANLEGADLQGASAGKSDLRGAILKDANLQDTWLANANLGDADLEGATLEGATLNGADLQGANLRGTNMKSTDLRKTSHLTQEQLEQGTTDEKTLLPDHLTLPYK